MGQSLQLYHRTFSLSVCWFVSSFDLMPGKAMQRAALAGLLNLPPRLCSKDKNLCVAQSFSVFGVTITRIIAYAKAAQILRESTPVAGLAGAHSPSSLQASEHAWGWAPAKKRPYSKSLRVQCCEIKIRRTSSDATMR